MYSVGIFNNNIETIIHYPNTDKEAPHLDKLPLKEGLSIVDSLSFVLYPNNPGYNGLFELTTKVKVIDTRDNTTRVVGRVIDVNEKMDNNGLFYKEVLCEGALSYLNDSKQRANAFATTNVTTFLTQILAIHNSKVDASKQIQVGNVDVAGSVAHSCDFKSTLAEILAVKEKIGGNIKIRETEGILYMDWLQSFSITTIDVNLGGNMKDMIKGKDVTSLGTRIIPLGANNLTIASVNGGLDYIEDTAAVIIYGVIEKTVEYKDIISATELKNTCLADLIKYTQPLLLLESNALDLSYLTDNKAEQFALGTNLHLVNPVMAIDSIYKVVQIDLDLLKAYDPKLTIANFPLKLSNSINDLRKSSIQKESVSNGVQIGEAFGIRIVSTDGKTVTTLNATEGISIEDKNRNIKVFYVDVNGNIVHDGKQQVTSNGKILIENFKNANGGTSKLYDNNGNLNVKIGSENGDADNVGGSLLLYNDSPSEEAAILALYQRVALGISKNSDCGIMQLLDHTGYSNIRMSASNDIQNKGAEIYIIDDNGITSIKSDSIIVGSESVATQTWVNNQSYASDSDLNTLYGILGTLEGRIAALETP